MILTPVPAAALEETLDRFMTRLCDRFSRAVFGRIRATSAERAEGAEAEQHRLDALAMARAFGLVIHPEGMPCKFNWDGVALSPATEAYVILHEVAHFALAAPERRGLIEFGLGPGPDTLDRVAAEHSATVPPLEREADEAAASLLGIIWEARLGQPALASFLDQNWLEGLDRSAPEHFTAVLETLRRRGMLSAVGMPVASIVPKRGRERGCWSRWRLPTPRH
jgi:hypothetical protein